MSCCTLSFPFTCPTPAAAPVPPVPAPVAPVIAPVARAASPTPAAAAAEAADAAAEAAAAAETATAPATLPGEPTAPTLVTADAAADGADRFELLCPMEDGVVVPAAAAEAPPAVAEAVPHSCCSLLLVVVTAVVGIVVPAVGVGVAFGLGSPQTPLGEAVYGLCGGVYCSCGECCVAGRRGTKKECGCGWGEGGSAHDKDPDEPRETAAGGLSGAKHGK